MAGYASQLLRLRELVISPNQQTAYLTALGDGSMTHNLRHDGKSFAQIPTKKYYDDSQLAKGWPQPTFRIEIQRTSKLALSGLPVYDFIAGWLGAFAFGQDAVSGSGPYTHLFTQDLATTLSPVTTIWCKDTNDVMYKMTDMAIESLKFTGSAVGPIMCDASLVGSGQESDGTIATVPALVNPTFMLNNDTDIQIGPPGTPVSIKQRIKSWSVTIGTPQNAMYTPGSGIYSSFTRRGDLSLSVSLSIEAKDTDDIRTLFLNDTMQELVIACNSGAGAQLTFDFPHIAFKGAGAADGDFVMWNLDADETSIFKPTSGDEPIKMTVVNNQATYLVAA